MYNLYILFNVYCICDWERIFKLIYEYLLVIIWYICYKGVKLYKLYLICKNYGYKFIVGFVFIILMDYELKVLYNLLKEK